MENRATLFVLKSEGKYVSGVTPLGVITTTDELARAAFMCERDMNHLDKALDGCIVVRVECILREQAITEIKLSEMKLDGEPDKTCGIDLWMEGYYTNGDSSPARYCGHYKVSCLSDAVKAWSAEDYSRSKHVNMEDLTFWGCRFFDNELEARRTFG